MKSTIRNILLTNAEYALKIQKSDGSFPPGHNGPWNNVDTPIRTTSHWTILLIKAFILTGKNKYKKAAERAGDFLLSTKARPFGYSFHCCISNEPILEPNGLIGQTWAIEALIELGLHINKKYLDIASEVVFKHMFDNDTRLWKVLSIRGEILNIHTTLNQQVWFNTMAYKVARLIHNNKLREKCECFINNNVRWIKNSNGIIDMWINESRLFGYYPIRTVMLMKSRIQNGRKIKQESIGYLSFMLYGYAILYQCDKTLSIWDDTGFKNIIKTSIKYIDENQFGFTNTTNKFAFSYNPVGFEFAYVLSVFGDYIDYQPIHKPNEWVTKQLTEYCDPKQETMSINTQDKTILSARIYEIGRLYDLHIIKESQAHNKAPVISVIMAVYNSEKYLDESIPSILNQIFKDFELIIIDDKSKDNSLKIIRQYAKKDKRIKIIVNKKNIGAAATRNRGLRVAKGEYVAIMDSDDISLPSRLQVESEYLDTHHGVFLIGSYANILTDSGETRGIIKFPLKNDKIKKEITKSMCFIHPTIMFRNDKKYFYRSKFIYAQDYDFILNMVYHKNNVENLPIVLLNYRFNPNSISFSKRNIQKKFGNIASEFYKQKIESGADKYSNFNFKLLLRQPKKNEKFDFENEISAQYGLDNYAGCRVLIMKYWHKYGFISKPKFVLFYLSTYVNPSVMAYIKRVI